MGGTLYIVATPIGDASDITERARRVLTEADLIAAEDTRTTGALLKALNIKGKMVSYHKFNENYRVDFILGELERGLNVAVLSDAGTPGISDPGAIIVGAALNGGYKVAGVCGVSAITAALAISGFAFDTFTFYGFMPRARKDIIDVINEARKKASAASVFFESPKRILKTLGILEEISPEASLCLCNDLTKTYERIYRGAPQAVLVELSGNPSAEKGEYTLVYYMGLAVKNAPIQGGGDSKNVLSAEAAMTDFIVKNGCNPKDAVRLLSKESGYTKNELYKAAVNLKKIMANMESV